MFSTFSVKTLIMGVLFGVLVPSGDVTTDWLTVMNTVTFCSQSGFRDNHYILFDVAACKACYQAIGAPAHVKNLTRVEQINFDLQYGPRWTITQVQEQRTGSDKDCFWRRDHPLHLDPRNETGMKGRILAPQRYWVPFHKSWVSDCSLIQAIAYAMIVPILLNLMFSVNHWRDDYTKGKTTLWAIPILVMHAYPQWQVLRLIYTNWGSPKQMEKEYAKWEREVGMVEPFVESILQVPISFSLPYS